MTVPLLARIEDWSCPNCHHTERTRRLPANAQRFHPCPGLKGLTAPLVRAGINAKVEAVERPTMIGAERGVRLDEDGRAVMGVQVTRDDGTDMAVFAATAVANLRG